MNTSETITNGGEVSEVGTKMDEQDMDELVRKASAPNLASLFRKGKDKGLIKAQQEYGHTT